MKRKKIFLTLALIVFSLTLVFAEESQSEEVKKIKYSSDSLVESMKANSQSIRSAKNALSSAEIDHKKAISDYFPKIAYSAAGAYIGNPIKKITLSSEDAMTLFDWPEYLTPTSNGGYVTLYDGMENSYYSFSLTALQPILTWGKLTDQLKLTKVLESTQRDKLSFSLVQNEAQVRARVEALYYLEKIEEVCKASKEDAERLSFLVGETERVGMTTTKEAYEAMTVKYAMEYADIQAESEINNQEQSLRDLTGLYELEVADIDLKVLSVDEYKKILETGEFEMIAKAISDEKESIRLSNRAVEAARIKKHFADFNTLYTPDIIGFASLSYSGSRFPLIEKGWQTKDDWQFLVGLKLSGTLFDGGKQFFNKKEGSLSVEAASLQKESVINQLTESVKSTRGQLRASLAGIEYRKADLREKEEKLRQMTEGFNIGKNSEIEYLKASLEKAKSETELYTEYIKLSTSYWTLTVLI